MAGATTVAKKALNLASAAKWGAGTGIGNALLLDHLQTNSHTGEQIPVWSTLKDLFTGQMDSERLDRLGANLLFGAVAGSAAGGADNAAAKITAALGAPGASLVKDSLIPVPATLQSFRNNQFASTALKAALGIGALGLGGAALAKYLTSRDGEGDVAKARYKIQGKPGDPYSDAEIEVPIDDPEFSDSMLADIGKNVRNQARKNLRSNTTKMDPKTGQQIPFDEWDRKYGNLTEEALRELKQKHGTLKNVSTDTDNDTGWFDWNKSAAVIYLRTNIVKQANPNGAPLPPQPVQPMGPAQPQGPAAPPVPQHPQMNRPVGNTPPPAQGIAAGGSPDLSRIGRTAKDAVNNIRNIAQKSILPNVTPIQ